MESDDEAVPGPGSLTVYLGSAVGVGKTSAMLREGVRQAAAGRRVLIAQVERHGRPATRAERGDLELVAPRLVTYRGATFEEVDVEAVVARHPDLALVDELAHRDPVEGRPRWQEVVELTRAGLDVLATCNVANVASVRPLAAEVIGAGEVAEVPDRLLRAARVHLVDLPPDALRARVAAGHVYPAERVDEALAHAFREPVLAALSDLAHAWMADRLEEEGPAVVARATGRPLERPCVLAALSASAVGPAVLARAAELAGAHGAELVAVHVAGTGRRDPGQRLDAYRRQAEALGATVVEVAREDVVAVLVETAARYRAGWLVVGRHRSRALDVVRGSVARKLARALPGVAVEVVEHPG